MMTQGITKQTTAIASEVGANYAVQSTTQGFLSDANPVYDKIDAQVTPKREPIKHTLIGSSKAVISTIRVLHQLRYAEVGDWSPLLPTGNTDEFMSILIRSILVQ
jgi:hypothetical protein